MFSIRRANRLFGCFVSITLLTDGRLIRDWAIQRHFGASCKKPNRISDPHIRHTSGAHRRVPKVWPAPEGHAEMTATPMKQIAPSRALTYSLVSLLASALPTLAGSWVTYEPKAGTANGKTIVLLSGDEEYRSEESLPQMGKILSQKHGFKCTVLFTQDADGTINPNNQTNIPRTARCRHGALRPLPRQRQADDGGPDSDPRLQLRAQQAEPLCLLLLDGQGRRLWR
jgi:hypothetical protein